jgi:hypothetical protein
MQGNAMVRVMTGGKTRKSTSPDFLLLTGGGDPE